jgi:hypothetical protein
LATVNGARSAFNSIVKFPIEVTTWTCGETLEAAGLAAVFAAAAGLAALLAADFAGAAAGAAAGAGEVSAAKAECRQAVDINPRMSKSCFISGF